MMDFNATEIMIVQTRHTGTQFIHDLRIKPARDIGQLAAANRYNRRRS